MLQDSRLSAAMPCRRQLLRLVAALPVAAALAACSNQPPPVVEWTTPRFQQQGSPVWLQVARLDVIDSYVPPLTAPNIESTLPVTLGDTAVLWAQERLRATESGRNQARVTFTRASVTETPLPRTEGISGLFTRDQIARVETDLIGELEIFDPSGQRLGFTQAQVTRGRTISEDATLNERQKILNELINDTVTTFGRNMETEIRQKLSRFVAAR